MLRFVKLPHPPTIESTGDRAQAHRTEAPCKHASANTFRTSIESRLLETDRDRWVWGIIVDLGIGFGVDSFSRTTGHNVVQVARWAITGATRVDHDGLSDLM